MAGPVNPKIGFTYSAPTQNTDGSAIGVVLKYQIGLGQVAGNYTLIVDDVQFENGQQVTPFAVVGKLAYGQWYAACRVITADGTSAWSNEAPFMLVQPTPSAPTSFTCA